MIKSYLTRCAAATASSMVGVEETGTIFDSSSKPEIQRNFSRSQIEPVSSNADATCLFDLLSFRSSALNPKP